MLEENGKLPKTNSPEIMYVIQIAVNDDNGKVSYYDDWMNFSSEKKMRNHWKTHKFRRPRYQMAKYTYEVLH